MPRDHITEAQALAVVIRSIDGYQDETMMPWYHEYYILGQQIGLITNETQQSVSTTYITRRKLAERLHTAFYLEDDTGADGQYIYETEVDSSSDCTSYEQYDSQKKVCYYSCDDDQSCKQIQSQIDQELDTYTDSLQDADRNFTEQPSETETSKTSKAVYSVAK
jgi:hypothetical protein